MITKLNAEQKALMQTVKDEWIAIGFATGKADEREMEAAVRLLYRCEAAPEPDHVLFFGSPKAGGLAVVLLNQHYQQYPETNFGYSPPPQDLHTQVRDLMAMDRLPRTIRKALTKAYKECRYGQHDTSLAFYDYFRRLGVAGLESLDGSFAVARCCGWLWTLPNIAVVTHRPIRLNRSDDGHLHCADGLAVEYDDGWGLHMWHGTNVPQHFVSDPSSITAEELHDIEKEQKDRLDTLLEIPLPADEKGEKEKLAEIARHRHVVANLPKLCDLAGNPT
jgi:hypothetical protein